MLAFIFWKKFLLIYLFHLSHSFIESLRGYMDFNKWFLFDEMIKVKFSWNLIHLSYIMYDLGRFLNLYYLLDYFLNDFLCHYWNINDLLYDLLDHNFRNNFINYRYLYYTLHNFLDLPNQNNFNRNFVNYLFWLEVRFQRSL